MQMSGPGCVFKVFTLLGIALLLGASATLYSTVQFLDSAATAQGQVVELEAHRDSDGTTYFPQVVFRSLDGQSHRFTSSSGANPPSYHTGEQVEVLYRPERPDKARINGFFSLWGASLILAIMGLCFSAIGLGRTLYVLYKKRRQAWLKASGQPVEATISSVEKAAFSYNDTQPFVIKAQWQDPASKQVFVFQSEYIWFDPLEYLDRDNVTVRIAPGNPRQYWMDISFLPELAN